MRVFIPGEIALAEHIDYAGVESLESTGDELSVPTSLLGLVVQLELVEPLLAIVLSQLPAEPAQTVVWPLPEPWSRPSGSAVA